MTVEAPTRLHADEFPTDTKLVRRLIAAQCPPWAALPVRVFPSAGSDHTLFRLGDDLAVRLPRKADAAGQTEHDLRWLPVLGPHLPLAVPRPVALGHPGEGFPWTWGVYRWLPGKPAHREVLDDLPASARTLAGFIRALQACETEGAPHADPQSLQRGAPLRNRDAWTRENIAKLPADLDRAALIRAWEAALSAPDWTQPPVWLHGDLQSGNLLADGGQLRAVIDFGSLKVGDPAAELAVAWNWLDTPARAAFRKALGTDEATWARARGWALSIATAEIPYYLHTNRGMVARSRFALEQVLAEQEP